MCPREGDRKNVTVLVSSLKGTKKSCCPLLWVHYMLQQVSDVYLDQKKFYESALSETQKQNDILKEQNDKLQKQLIDAQNIISSSKDAYERNSQVISDAQDIILRQSEYIEKLKDDLSHHDEQTSEKKGFFSKLFGL